jgi:hypothetical protein
MKKIKKLKFKKLLNEYRSLYYEYEYILEACQETLSDFDDNLRNYCEKNDIDIEELNKKLSPKKQQETDMVPFEDECLEISKSSEDEEYDAKKLFRQVARAFHPDMLNDEDPDKLEKEEIFKRASVAIENKNWGELFNIADRYDLDLDDYISVNNSLRLDIQRMKEKIKEKQGTYSWLLYTCEDNVECMDRVAKSFLEQMYNYK